MKKVFMIFVAVFLVASCANTSSVDVESRQESDNCPLKWDESLNNRENCTTKEYSGIKINTCWKNDKQDGSECYYSENGMIFVEVNWIDGMQNGLAIQYYDNGNPKLVRNYKNDKLYGTYKQFYKNGNLMFNGYRDGFCNLKYGTCYTENGTAVPLKKEDLSKACYNMLCLDAIEQQYTSKP